MTPGSRPGHGHPGKAGGRIRTGDPLFTSKGATSTKPARAWAIRPERRPRDPHVTRTGIGNGPESERERGGHDYLLPTDSLPLCTV